MGPSSVAVHRRIDPGHNAQEGPQMPEVEHLVEDRGDGEGTSEPDEELGAGHECDDRRIPGPLGDPSEFGCRSPR